MSLAVIENNMKLALTLSKGHAPSAT